MNSSIFIAATTIICTIALVLDKYFDNTHKDISISKRPIPVVHDSFNVLADILEKQDKISEKDQKTIEKQIIKGEPLTESKNINILFNPIQNDFIPIKTKLADDEKREIINTINKELIPTQLPPITQQSLPQAASSNSLKTRRKLLLAPP